MRDTEVSNYLTDEQLELLLKRTGNVRRRLSRMLKGCRDFDMIIVSADKKGWIDFQISGNGVIVGGYRFKDGDWTVTAQEDDLARDARTGESDDNSGSN